MIIYYVLVRGGNWALVFCVCFGGLPCERMCSAFHHAHSSECFSLMHAVAINACWRFRQEKFDLGLLSSFHAPPCAAFTPTCPGMVWTWIPGAFCWIGCSCASGLMLASSRLAAGLPGCGIAFPCQRVALINNSLRQPQPCDWNTHACSRVNRQAPT